MDATASASNVSSQAAPQAAAPASPAATSSHDGKDDAGSARDTGDASALAVETPATTSSPQPPANPVQPVAAIIVNPSIDATPAPTDAASSAGAAPINGRARAQSSVVGDQVAVAGEDTTDGAAAKPPSSSAQAEKAANAPSGSSAEAAKNQISNRTSAQPGETQTADNAVGQAQAKNSLPAGANNPPSPAADPSTESSASATSSAPSAQEQAVPAKAATAGLPDFGFSATNAASPAIAAATPTATTAAASTAAVPIAGLAVAIAARAQGGSNQFDIRLDPPELGRIDVRLDVSSDGQVTTHMTADRAETLQLLQSQQPQLERALEQAGLKTADNSLQFTLRDQSFAGQQNGSNPQSNGSAQIVVPDPDLTPVAATQIYTRTGLGSGVDIRV